MLRPHWGRGGALYFPLLRKAHPPPAQMGARQEFPNAGGTLAFASQSEGTHGVPRCTSFCSMARCHIFLREDNAAYDGMPDRSMCSHPWEQVLSDTPFPNVNHSCFINGATRWCGPAACHHQRPVHQCNRQQRQGTAGTALNASTQPECFFCCTRSSI